MLDTIGERIKFLRERDKMTQQELAIIAGVSNKAVSSWEMGTKEPRMGAVEKIAKYFGVRKSDIIDGSEYLEQKHFVLTDEEETIINVYRRLNEEQKKTLNSYLAFLKAQK